MAEPMPSRSPAMTRKPIVHAGFRIFPQ